VINSWKLSDLGCQINGVYIGCLVYADDIILLSASVGTLQKMLDICYASGTDINIMFNAKKSSLFVVGKAHTATIDCLKMGPDTISWSNELKYLGVYFKSGRTLLINTQITMRTFYAAANAIYSHVKYASEITVLFLTETFCLPLLSYSCEAMNYTKQQLNQLHTCWNRAYRKAFHMNSWESVKELQALRGRLDFVHIYAERKLLFLSKMSHMENDVGKCSVDIVKDKVFSSFYNIAIVNA